MPGAPIDGSLRRPILPTQDRGTEIADSRSKLAATPQLIMEPGAVRPVFKFDDGEGLTDAFGNVYEGYGGAGRSSLVIRHTPAETVDEEVDATAEDEDFLQFDGDREKFETRSYTESKLAKVAGAAPADGQTLKFVFVNDQFEPSDTVASPFNEPDFISAIIEIPQDRTYTLVQSIPYDITITGDITSIATGSANVAYPSGTITAGNVINITVSSVSVDVEFLRIQLNFNRTFAT